MDSTLMLNCRCLLNFSCCLFFFLNTPEYSCCLYLWVYLDVRGTSIGFDWIVITFNAFDRSRGTFLDVGKSNIGLIMVIFEIV